MWLGKRKCIDNGAMRLWWDGPSVDMTPLSPDNYKYLHTHVISPDTKRLHCFNGSLLRLSMMLPAHSRNITKNCVKTFKWPLGALD